MRLFAFTILLLLGTACQKTEVSVNQTKNNNEPTRVSTENTRAENTKKEETKTPFKDGETKSPANKTAAIAPADGVEKRCGWLENPTPANFWFSDKDGEWTIGVQGGYQAEGMDNIPDFGNEWVKTNGNYGYGCMCMNVKVDKKEKQVIEIKSASVRPLSACRNDKSLKEPKDN